MALNNIWTEPSGYSFGINYENLKTDIALPVENDDGVIYSVITTEGELPGGLYIEGNHIVGTIAPLLNSQPSSVTYTFTIKAYKNSEISTRIFTIVVNKQNIWLKKSGYNLCHIPSFGNNVSAVNLVKDKEYVIVSVGSTNFSDIGAISNTVGTVFKATGSGTGSGVASETWINERRAVNQLLPVNNAENFSYFVLSGQLPPGLRISTNKIVGTPFEVSRRTVFTFCIRATNGYQLSDRTFTITLEGADEPIIITTGDESGTLPVGTNEQYFVLSNSYVDYQIEAIDYDTTTGQTLTFYVANDEGNLPPGLVLTPDGRLVGYVQPVLSIKPEDGNGHYDIGYYDTISYDWGLRPSNGYDSYLYDQVIFDYNIGSKGPTKINRYYQFVVSVTDGDTIAKRTFKIFVVSDDYFSADNTLLLIGTGLFTADATYLRTPLWITPKFLGTYRANNYVTLIIDTYDVENIVYKLELVNCDITATTKQFELTDNVVGSTSITIINPTSIPVVGQYFTFDGKFNGGTERLYYITDVTNLGNNYYRLTFSTSDGPLDIVVPDNVNFFIGSVSVLPPGLSFDVISAEVIGNVPYQPAVTTSYSFTITATRLDDTEETAESSRTFTIDIIGEIDSVISWNTPPDLGSINANFISTLSVNASSTVTNSVLLYGITSGSLPPGLILNLDGEIIGKVRQYPNAESGDSGITTFDQGNESTTFDNGTTTFDHLYTFTVEAKDQFGLSAISRTFTIYVNTPSQILYSNLRVQPYLKLDQRAVWKEFINDSTIFTPNSIYRPNDANFGIHRDLSMIVYAGIETLTAAQYVSAMGLNHKRKRFQFGSVQKAVAIVPQTTTEVYEVIYVEMFDPMEPNSKRLPNSLTLNGTLSHNTDLNGSAVPVNLAGRLPGKVSADSSTNFWNRNPSSANSIITGRPEPIVTVDGTGYIISDPLANKYFPNSISNWRDRIKDIGLNERNYLPLWMRSIQPGTKKEIGFKLVVPLCYCKVGTADDIILNIKYSGFNFKLLDYTIDRYIIDSIEGSEVDKYLVFRNDRITV